MRSRISSATERTSSPGATDFISRRIIPRFCMSARTASATPGYCTFTATVRPSSRRALYTCPIDAAAIGTGSKVSKTSSSFSPYSRSMTRFMSLTETFGAASRSSASLAWNASWCSGGTSPTSRKLMTCPSFIAAPFIVPSAATICSAVSICRFSSACARSSSSRPTLATRVPSCLAPCPAASLPTRAARAHREVGRFSLATRGSLRGGRIREPERLMGHMDPKVVPAQTLARIAGRAWGVATTEEMLRAGLTSDQIKSRVRSGALIREHRGVYRVGHRAPSVEARYMAAVKAGGDGAVLCGDAAAHHFRLLRGPAPPPEVMTPGNRRITGVTTRRSTRIERTTWRRIPVLTVPRILVEMAGTHSFDDLGYACHQAHVLHHVSPEQVEAVLRRHPNAKDIAKLRAILWGDAPIMLSKLERAFRKLLRDAGLPLPITNRPAGAHYVDCRWPDRALTLELDSYRYHATRHALELDRRRDREAYARGDQVRRYTYGDVIERPKTVLAELQPLLTRDPGTMSSRPSGQRTHAL